MLSQNSGLLAAALLYVASSFAQGASAPICTENQEARVAYLLGCCGDLEPDYPGRRFPTLLNGAERATLALNEIDIALKQPCYRSESGGAQTLALNRIGAMLMRARALATASPTPGDMLKALSDIDSAEHYLATFSISYPTVAVRMWYWIAMAHQRSGHSWEALAFVNQLPKDCCAAADIEVFRGDLYFELGMYEPATKHYSEWLSALGSGSLCGHAVTINNIHELRQHGFSVPDPHPEPGATCVSGDPWRSYVSAPR